MRFGIIGFASTLALLSLFRPISAGRVHTAAQEGNVEALVQALEEGEEVNAVHGQGMTPLLLAVGLGHHDAALVLIRRGADVDLASASGAAPLHLAVANGDSALVSALLAAGASAVRPTMSGGTSLHDAAYLCHPAIVGLLLEAGAEVAATDAGGYQAVHAAAAGCCSGALKQLIEAEASPSAAAENGETPLLLAVDEGCVEAARILIQAGADVSAPDEQGSTALHRAVKSADPDVVLLLLENGAPVNAVDSAGDAALHIAAFRRRTELVEILLQRGADPNAPGQSGTTPLHYAYSACAPESSTDSTGCARLLRLLISHGARDSAEVAHEVGEAVALLMDSRRSMPGTAGGAPLEQPGGSRASALARGSEIGALDKWGGTRLHEAAFRGDSDLALTLIREGEDVNAAIARTKITALHVAAIHAQEDVARVLLDAGAEVNVADTLGMYPIDYAPKGSAVAVAIGAAGGIPHEYPRFPFYGEPPGGYEKWDSFSNILVVRSESGPTYYLDPAGPWPRLKKKDGESVFYDVFSREWRPVPEEADPYAP